ncbi:MAG TPA: alginate lyase family protein [Opitutaceae bacterium]|nr:alginate lyase family protein [Opitutaceae bacterium]
MFLALLLLPHFDLQAHEKARVVALADAALHHEPRTITSVINPRSPGGPHDFSSEGDYWWPDPKNPNGPYIKRDGMTNPDNFTAHRELLLDFARDTDALIAAYRITRDERYAAAAVKQLDAWFVNPETRMYPNLQYAQAIKGVCTGRGIGIIDTVHLAEVALGVRELRGSKSLSPLDDGAITRWFRSYLLWIRVHPYGRDESKADNNHGTCWALQAACFARLAGDEAVLADCRRRFKEVILKQMAPDGSFPRELGRTKAYGYSIFNLDVMTALAQVLSTPQENLVTYQLPDGRSLIRGIEFLAPYLADKSKWPKPPDVMYWTDWPVRQPALLFGALATGNEDWLKLWERLPADPTVEEIRRNFPIREPVLWVDIP